MRLFVALPVADDVRRQLATTVEPARAGEAAGTGSSSPRRGWRWTRPEGWHVTLAFLGEVEPDRLEDVARAGTGPAAGTGRIELRLGALGRFGRGVLHVTVADRPVGTVAHLGARMQEALAAGGLPVHQREVTPHLTLARARRGADPAMPSLQPPSASWTVDEARVYASHLGPGGATYEVVERLPLA